ncbi:hypothetical protein BDV96DRAFT_691644 [Lophiotrema nucula]|uniref:Uncharacterized protein n=1 Tax=Lophiotrema nucula TaxID=690887 RepID=A0A6A5YRG4_9PLEO|nr:hypothetical protein BDV96DRAFT_691644 [Lophiotrema nucula]
MRGELPFPNPLSHAESQRIKAQLARVGLLVSHHEILDRFGEPCATKPSASGATVGATNKEPGPEPRPPTPTSQFTLNEVNTATDSAGTSDFETSNLMENCDPTPKRVSQVLATLSSAPPVLPVAGYCGPMLSEDLQRTLLEKWAEGTGIALDPDKTIKHEFARLAKVKGWIGGHEEWNSRWLACFGSQYGYTGLKGAKMIQRSNESNPRKQGPFKQLNLLPDDADYEQEFFRIAHSRELVVGSASWRRYWRQWMEEPWVNTEWDGYSTNGAPTNLQHLCFGVYSEFKLDGIESAVKEFNKLAGSKKWNSKQVKRERQWCFGKSLPATFISPSQARLETVKSCNVSTTGSYSIINTPTSTRCGSLASDVGYESDVDSLASATGSAYWKQFIGFEPNPDANVPDEFDRLSLHEGWTSGSSEWRSQKGDAYEEEFEHWYGAEKDKLKTWQDLCREVGIDPAPETITQCRKALKGVLVNLVNLIDHRRNGTPLLRFATYSAFRKYTSGGHIFPKDQAKRDGFVKALLKHLY